MIHLKLLYKKTYLKYFIILFILITSIITLLCLKEDFNYKISKEKNSIDNRTIYVTFNLDFDENIFEKSKYIVDFTIEDDNYKIILTSPDEYNKFKQDYEKEINTITKPNFDTSNYNLSKKIINLVLITNIIIILITFYMLLINLKNSLKEDINLYKLIGFNNKKIISIVITFFITIISIIYIISIFTTKAIIYILNKSNLIVVTKMISIKNIIFIYLIVLIIACISFLPLIYQIIKHNPLKFTN